MAQPLPLTDLEIVGYAERFLPEMLPAIAPPVFRHRSQPDCLLVPPFHEAESMLYGAAEINTEECDHLVAKGQVTRFPNAIPAKPAHELWFDEEFVQHYEPFVDARDRLREIADSKIDQAQQALYAGNLDAAERLTAVAIRADDGRQEPFAIRAAIRLSRGKTNAIAVMKLLAPPTIGDTAFAALVEYYSGYLRQAPVVQSSAPADHQPLPSRGRPMQGVAARKPALAKAA